MPGSAGTDETVRTLMSSRHFLEGRWLILLHLLRQLYDCHSTVRARGSDMRICRRGTGQGHGETAASVTARHPRPGTCVQLTLFWKGRRAGMDVLRNGVASGEPGKRGGHLYRSGRRLGE